MKASALYHLLQLRAKKLHQHVSSEYAGILTEIQDSLHVDRKSGVYSVSWVYDSKSFTIIIPNDKFKFYIKGDSKKALTNKSQNIDYRAFNWSAALEVWREIFNSIGLDPALIADDGLLSYGNFTDRQKRNSIFENIFICILISAASVLATVSNYVIEIFITSFILIIFADNYCMVQTRKKLNYFEKIVVGAGAIVPVYFGVNPVYGVSVILGMHLILYSELKPRSNKVIYYFSGAILGIGLHQSIYFSSATIITVMVVMVALSLVDKSRVCIKSVYLLFAGFVSIASILFMLNYYNIIDLAYPPNDIKNAGYLFLLNTLVTSFLIISFALWWITGVQYYLLPWVSLLSFGVASAIIAFNGLLFDQAIYASLSGFVLFILLRIWRGFTPGLFVRQN